MCVSNADKIIPVDFRLDRNGSIPLSTHEYVTLMENSKSYVIGSGKNCIGFNIVHTSAGYVNVRTYNSRSSAEWLADPFEVKAVVADDKNDHYADIKTANGIVRMPFEAFLPNKIDTSLFNKGIAVNTNNRAHMALSMHLQYILSKYEVSDAREVLGWKYLNDNLTWSGTNTKPPLLNYKLSLSSEKEYLDNLNFLISDCPALQFSICVAIASVLLAYLSMRLNIPVAPFGLSLVGISSTGKTTALRLAASMFSSPDDEAVFTGFYGTNNALVHMLGMHHGVPLCFDETTIDNNLSKANFVYTFSEGKSKLRLDQQSQLKERYTWLCTILLCSESLLVDITNTDKLGLSVRILNLENCVYTRDAQHADEIKTFAMENYGIVGNMISDYLLKENPEEVKQDYNNIRAMFNSLPFMNKSSLTDRLVLNFSVILHTALILDELGIKIDITAVQDICVGINNKITENAQPGKKSDSQNF